LGEFASAAAFQKKVRLHSGNGISLADEGSSWLAYAGAIVTIASLLVGTFTQQLLTIKYFPVKAIGNDENYDSPGNMPWSVYWQNFTGRSSERSKSEPLH